MPGAREIVRALPRRARRRAIVDHPRHRHDGRDRARAGRRPGSTAKTIVLTGAMVPYAFGSSDGLFNLGSALSFVQVLPPGVYVAMNGQHFAWDRSARTARPACFEAGDDRHDHARRRCSRGCRRSAPPSSPSCRSWRRTSARSTCRRAFPTSTAIRRWSTPSRGTCATGATSTRRCRACRRCAQAIAAKYARSTAAATIPRPRSPSRPAAPRRSSTRSPPSCIRATRSSCSSPATTPTCPRSS